MTAPSAQPPRSVVAAPLSLSRVLLTVGAALSALSLSAEQWDSLTADEQQTFLAGLPDDGSPAAMT